MSTKRRGTYRLQLNSNFTLDDARRVVDYLAELGVSHVYLSPVLQATAESTHGYDVVDAGRVSEALGGEETLERLVEAVKQREMAVLLDIVPNHMAISPQNPWWWDVLKNGPASRYASYFDVEWDAVEARNSNRILLPVLGDHYGRVLDAGEIRLTFDGSNSVVTCYDDVYPVDPCSLALILDRAAARVDNETLDFLAQAFAQLPQGTGLPLEDVYRRQRDQGVLAAVLDRLLREDEASTAALEAVVADINGDAAALDQFLNEQNYRLAFWRVGDQEGSYRRFFDVNSLVAVRVEDERVFEDTHRLALGWLEDGMVDGLRVDHPDGLSDPLGYFQRLADRQPEAWLLAEKILESEEELPQKWPIAGTTGYDFLNQVNGLFVDPRGEAPLSEFYAAFTGERKDVETLVYEKKKLVMDTILGSDVAQLTEMLVRSAGRHRRTRDYTRQELREALVELAASMPVYRTYVRPEEKTVDLQDGLCVDDALAAARERRPDVDAALFDFLRDLLLLGVNGEEADASFVKRFQQFTGPVMAKGVEDTVFYNYNRLMSLNEVGGNPARFGVGPDEFHARCVHRQRFWPYSLLATSTHDTKRSEDVRARINVISEMPEAWIEAVQSWSGRARGNPDVMDDAPDRNDEYLFYQNLVGAWPISEERMQAYMVKAVRESKRRTSWTEPDEDYERGLATFVSGVMSDEALMSDIEAFVAQLVEPGRINSLAQTLLKLTVPGIPDLYQGTELWSLSLVDPDNRRAVDYEARLRLLQELCEAPDPEQIVARADEGLPKLWVINRTLQLRAARPDLFEPASEYRPLRVEQGEAALAFTRGEELVVVAPRLTLRSDELWQKATVRLPEATWNNVFTGEIVQGGEAPVPVGQLLARFPVALLLKH